MTRQEIYNTYKIKDGIIQDPGMFEGETVWTPYYYDLAKCGLYDENRDNEVFTFRVNNIDRIHFRELRKTHTVKLYVGCKGFVSSHAIEERVTR